MEAEVRALRCSDLAHPEPEEAQAWAGSTDTCGRVVPALA